MTTFTDEAAKSACQAECDKRNKHISKHHPMRWKCLFDPATKVWTPSLRPAVTIEKKAPRKVLHREGK